MKTESNCPTDSTGRKEVFMKYYIAYGSNLDVDQMHRRCQDARKIGYSIIEDYELLFRGVGRHYGVATIEPCKGKRVPVGVWMISDQDEQALDRYEGWPRLYKKQNFDITVHGQLITAMAYIMTAGHRIVSPSPGYFHTIAQGYRDFGFDLTVLEQAVENAERRAGL